MKSTYVQDSQPKGPGSSNNFRHANSFNLGGEYAPIIFLTTLLKEFTIISIRTCSRDCSYPWFLNNLSLDKGPDSSEREVGSSGESAQRCKARLERHQRTVERVVSPVQVVIYSKF